MIRLSSLLRYIVDFLTKISRLYFVKHHLPYGKYDFGCLPCLNGFFSIKKSNS